MSPLTLASVFTSSYFAIFLVSSLTLNARAINTLCTHGSCKQRQMNLISLSEVWRHLESKTSVSVLGSRRVNHGPVFLSHCVCDVNYQSAGPSFWFSWSACHLASFIKVILFYFCAQVQIKKRFNNILLLLQKFIGKNIF